MVIKTNSLNKWINSEYSKVLPVFGEVNFQLKQTMHITLWWVWWWWNSANLGIPSSSGLQNSAHEQNFSSIKHVDT